MGIYIKGMEMPKVPTRFIIFADGRVEDEDDSAYKYSAIPVPPHGKLIDKDALPLEESVPTVMMHDGEWWISAYELAMAPIVIPAEPPKEEGK